MKGERLIYQNSQEGMAGSLALSKDVILSEVGGAAVERSCLMCVILSEVRSRSDQTQPKDPYS
jgi:hypothetical protein